MPSQIGQGVPAGGVSPRPPVSLESARMRLAPVQMANPDVGASAPPAIRKGMGSMNAATMAWNTRLIIMAWIVRCRQRNLPAIGLAPTLLPS